VRLIDDAEYLRLRVLGLDVGRSVREGRDAVRDAAARIEQVVRDVADATGPVELLAHRRGAYVLRYRRAQPELVIDPPVEPRFPGVHRARPRIVRVAVRSREVQLL